MPIIDKFCCQSNPTLSNYQSGFILDSIVYSIKCSRQEMKMPFNLFTFRVRVASDDMTLSVVPNKKRMLGTYQRVLHNL